MMTKILLFLLVCAQVYSAEVVEEKKILDISPVWQCHIYGALNRRYLGTSVSRKLALERAKEECMLLESLQRTCLRSPPSCRQITQ